jgi:hypothetical protein
MMKHDDYDLTPDEEPHREKLKFPQIKRRSFDFGNSMFFVTSLNGEYWIEIWMPDTDQVSKMIHIAPHHTNATIVEALSLVINREQLREIMDHIRGDE